MIQLYGKTYAANDADFTASLFNPGGTCNGYYRHTPQGVYLSDMQGNERAFIRRDGLGPVSVGKDAKGRTFYMFAASSLDEIWLGVPDSYLAEVDGARELAKSLYPAQVPA